MNCIFNIASSRKVTLPWGAKKKSSNQSQLSIGNDVIVSNHGTKWEHHAKIIKMNDDGISVLVKWGTSLKRENVFLNDCRKGDQPLAELGTKQTKTIPHTLRPAHLSAICYSIANRHTWKIPLTLVLCISYKISM